MYYNRINDDDSAKKLFDQLNFREGDLLPIRTNAELLNMYFGTSYAGYQRNVWDYKPGVMVHMIHMDGQSRSGWVNIDKGDKFTVKNIDGANTWDGDHIRKTNLTTPYRITLQIINIDGKRYYKVRGIYKYNDQESSDENCFWVYKKI